MNMSFAWLMLIVNYPTLDTLFLAPSQEHVFLSSSLVREIALLGGDVTPFVPSIVIDALKKKRQFYATNS